MDHDRAFFSVGEVPGVFRLIDSDEMSVAGVQPNLSVAGKRMASGEYEVLTVTRDTIVVTTDSMLRVTDVDGASWGEFRVAEVRDDGTGQLNMRLEQQ